MHGTAKLSAAICLLFVLASCSVLYDLSPDQCGSTSDCTRFGGAYRCNDGVCVAPTAGSAGARNSGGNPSGASGGVSTTGGASADAGAGGQSPPPECTINRDCLTLYGDADPRVCRAGHCAALFTTECPVALPQNGDEWLENLYPTSQNPEPIVYGVFANVPAQTALGNMTRNYELALSEFNDIGLPAAGGRRRKLVAVVCRHLWDGNDALDVPLAHLVDELHVPAILASLPTEQLQHAIETKAIPNDVFFISPLDADRTLASLEDAGLAWHMLPGGDYVSVTYKPLLDRTISYLRRTAVLTATESVRVALITVEDDRYLGESGDKVFQTIRFNGDNSAAANLPNNFASFSIDSWNTDPGELHTETIDGVLAFAPHVVLAIGADEILATVIPALEMRWRQARAEQPAPFYLLSPVHFNNPQLPPLLTAFPKLYERLVGVNAASADDLTLYDAYHNRLVQSFGTDAVSGYENYYDAAYYLFHATAAAGTNASITGSDIAGGLRKLVVEDGTEFRVHPADIQAIFSALSGTINPRLALKGTLGPPNFDVAKGARAEPGSVWCVGADQVQHPDVLRYVKTVSGQTTRETLTGSFPSSDCFDFEP